MTQLSFADVFEKEEKGVLIPEDIVTPLESKEKTNSEAFNRERDTFVKYVEAIASHHGLSFVKAREVFLEHRDEQKPIELDTDFFF